MMSYIGLDGRRCRFLRAEMEVKHMQETDKSDLDEVISNYYGDEQVTALINLKVDTKDADKIAERISGFLPVEDVFLVTGDTDIVAKVKVQTYNQLKRFIIEDLSKIEGVKDTKTLMVVSTFKERGELRFEPGESETTGDA
ncbi:MAG: Lrp/AsnC family transcriptional regulator [Methanomassiliicoccales archaeon]